MQTNAVSTFKDQNFLASKREYLKRIYLGTKAERETMSDQQCMTVIDEQERNTVE